MLDPKFAVGVFSIAAFALSGCNDKATQALQEESSRTSSEVLILKEQIKQLEDRLVQQANSQNHLLEACEDSSTTIKGLEGNVAELKAADAKIENLIAVANSDANQIRSSVTDLYKFVQQLKNADQAEFERIQQRKREIEAASLPFKQRIAQLTAKREKYLANIMEIRARMERPLQRREGVSDEAAAAAAFAVLPEIRALQKVLNEQIQMNQRAIEEIDLAIQNERAQLLELRQNP